MKVVLLAVSLAIGVVVSLASTRAADAQEPTPTPLSDLGLNFDAVFGLIGAEPRIVWRAIPGVDHFHLTATLQALRVNSADPFCTPPAQHQTITVTVDETLPGTATEFRVTFPPLTGNDSWFVFLMDRRLGAVNGAGEQIGVQGGGGVAETMCARPQPAATRAAMLNLPSTGTGRARGDGSRRLVVALTASTLVVLGLIRRFASPTRP